MEKIILKVLKDTEAQGESPKFYLLEDIKELAKTIAKRLRQAGFRPPIGKGHDVDKFYKD